MKIVGENGEILSLTKTRLKQVEGYSSSHPWRVRLRDLKSALGAKKDMVNILGRDLCGRSRSLLVSLSNKEREIGCCSFSKREWAKIKKAVKEVK